MKSITKFEKRNLLRKKFKIIFIILVLIFVSLLIYKDFDKRIDIATNDLIKIKSKSIINSAVDNALDNVLEASTIKSTNFYTPTFDEDGELLTMEINTILINNICNKLSNEITKELESIKKDKIYISVFSLYNISLIYGTGPMISTEIVPIGYVDITYDKSFSQAGINQTNFDLWLNITCHLQMTSPISEDVVVETRKVPLVSTIINGAVPDYFETILNDND